MENVRKTDEKMIPGLDSFSNTMEELRADYEQMVGAYAAAIREINARLQNLNQEFQFHHKHNPIHHIKTRIKSMPSIMKKLRRKVFCMNHVTCCKAAFLYQSVKF